MRILIPIAAVLVSLTVVLGAYREGPLPDMTGGFGDSTCRSCHFDGALDAPGGRLAVSGVPVAYTPGRSYTIKVTLSRKGMERAGFEIAARFAAGADTGRQAGAWSVSSDGRVQMVKGQRDPALLFVQHAAAGSAVKPPGFSSWTMEWTAPSSNAPVRFNCAANAANDDASPMGDFIYLAERVAKGTPGRE